MKQAFIIFVRSLFAYAALTLALLAFWFGTIHYPSPSPKKSPLWEASAPLVVVDAGHGGHDGPAVANDLTEKNTALDLARRLQTHLEAKGVRVLMTREKDEFLTLEKRAQIANEAKAAAFVSMHLNTSVEDANSIHGMETYFCAVKSLNTIRKIKESFQVPSNVTLQDLRGKQLAEVIQRITCQRVSAEDRGAKERSLTVVQTTTCPSVLVECGFMTHKKEATQLKEESYRDRLASGVAEGVCTFLKAQELQPKRGLQLTEPKRVTPPAQVTAQVTKN